MTKERILSLTSSQTGRLDKQLAAAAMLGGEGLSRVRVQALIKEGCVFRRGGAPAMDPSVQAHAGEIFDVILPPPQEAVPKAQAIPLSVVYEDDDLLVLNKPPGLVVHPGAGNWEGTLVNALLAHCAGSLSGVGGVARPGIVHRLDKDTSGLMVVAKNDVAHRALTAQFTDRSLSRIYQALVWGVPSPLAGEVEGAIGRHPRARQKMAIVPRGGKAALTYYNVIETFGALASLVECRLATGRTHQIRVHMEHIKHPVIGDPVYGSRRRAAGGIAKSLIARLEAFPRQALHAREIHFLHPKTGKAMKFKAELPPDVKGLIRALRGAK